MKLMDWILLSLFIASILLTCIARPHGNNNSHFCKDAKLFQSDASTGKAELLCQRYETESRSVVLSWSSVVSESPPPVTYLLQARNFSDSNGHWKFLNMTNKDFIEVPNLRLNTCWQFLVTAVVSAEVSLPPFASGLIQIEGPNSTLGAPSDITVSNFELENGLLKSIVRWNASKELPCSYKILWWPSDEVQTNSTLSQTVVLPQDDLSVVLYDLVFGVNYTVLVTPEGRETPGMGSEFTFLTPTCLDMTGHNFSLCAPSQPLNVSVSVSPPNVVILTWLPPNNTSPQNPISNYYVLALDYAKRRINLKVAPDILNISFTHQNGSEIYYFEVRAASSGGLGNAAVVEIPAARILTPNAINDVPGHSVLWMTIIVASPCTVVLLLVAAFVLWKKKLKKKNKLAGCPSGTADVPSSLLPLLIPADKLRLTTTLGQGSFGIVQKGVYMRGKSEEEVAVKMLPSDTKSRKQLLQEVEIMQLVGRHNRTVGLLGFTLDIEKIFLVLEYCPMGDLHSFLTRLKAEILQQKSLPPVPKNEFHLLTSERLAVGKRLCNYVKQVAEGMEYISSLKLIHRDLAARNILMVDRDRVKIADFGLSRDVYETRFYVSTAKSAMPIKWMAPEAIERHKFSSASDVWSFGVFMWEVFKFGKEPYTQCPTPLLLMHLKNNYRLEKPYCRHEWYDLMLDCWSANPSQRPYFREIVRRVNEIIDVMYHYDCIAF